ncbi:hypothetical protein CHELA1G11_10866 [Hyphomicrobiales bacterium]|nr:hypothetical protein CHELA1G11_10866 [Hyphomicrobiales bacterium]CAH1671760.1 hypothetical protein CHELA1G2_13442 [Hyphomicrobiales bacterium]
MHMTFNSNPGAPVRYEVEHRDRCILIYGDIPIDALPRNGQRWSSNGTNSLRSWAKKYQRGAHAEQPAAPPKPTPS